MIFFEVVNFSYLRDAMILVAEQYGVLMDTEQMLMSNIMAMVTAASAKQEAKQKAHHAPR